MTTKEKEAARKKLQAAVRYGKLAPPAACEKCGAERSLDAHHSDYAKPLDVEWLCRKCHRSRHVGERRGLPQQGGRKPGRPTAPPPLPDEVTQFADIQRTHEEAQLQLRLSEDARNSAIRKALAEGWTHAQVAEVTGLTRGRIGQIAMQG